MNYSQAIIKSLIEKNIDSLIMLGNVGMLWWVSATVFCLSIIKSVYSENTISKAKSINTPITIIISVLITSIVCFGIMAAITVDKLHLETKRLLSLLNFYNDYGILFKGVYLGYLIGSTSFLLFLLIWIFLRVNTKQEDFDEEDIG